jgi:glycosyltransferase involved in cell wall biosynthesis
VGFGGRLAELARRLGCEGRVRFLGHRPDAASLMAGYDLVVCPSQLAESFCRVGVEALAAGVPVVASDVGAVREVCGQWPAVRYVRGGDVAAWMAAVRDALADSRMRQAARQDGPAYVRRRFSLRTYQSRMQRVILSAT